MTSTQSPWTTDGAGMLLAEANGYEVTVERLLPAADAMFVVLGGGDHRPIAFGIRATSQDAMLAAEQAAADMPKYMMEPGSRRSPPITDRDLSQ